MAGVVRHRRAAGRAGARARARRRAAHGRRDRARALPRRVPTAIAYVLFARGLRTIPAGETATLTLAEPLTAAALGVIVLGERPSAAAAVGAALVLAGLVLVAVRPTLAPAAPASWSPRDRRRRRPRAAILRRWPSAGSWAPSRRWTPSPGVLRARILEGDLEPGAAHPRARPHGRVRRRAPLRARGAAGAGGRGPGPDRAEPRRERRALRRRRDRRPLRAAHRAGAGGRPPRARPPRRPAARRRPRGGRRAARRLRAPAAPVGRRRGRPQRGPPRDRRARRAASGSSAPTRRSPASCCCSCASSNRTGRSTAWRSTTSGWSPTSSAPGPEALREHLAASQAAVTGAPSLRRAPRPHGGPPRRPLVGSLDHGRDRRERRAAVVRTPEEVVRDAFAAIARRDLEALGPHYAEDVVEDIVPVGVLRGRAAVVAFFDEVFKARAGPRDDGRARRHRRRRARRRRSGA